MQPFFWQDDKTKTVIENNNNEIENNFENFIAHKYLKVFMQRK
jgi:hypothetical protein